MYIIVFTKSGIVLNSRSNVIIKQIRIGSEKNGF